MKKKITLICSLCLNRNYYIYKSYINFKNQLKIKKYCNFCNHHNLHQETR